MNIPTKNLIILFLSSLIFFLKYSVKNFKLKENSNIINGTIIIFILGHVLNEPIKGIFSHDHVNKTEYLFQLK